MKKERNEMRATPVQVLGRGRIAHWTKEKLSTLTTIELRQLLANAQRLGEPEVAALVDQLLDERPHGRAVVRKPRAKAAGRRPTLAKAAP
jgi:hypothetical protein